MLASTIPDFIPADREFKLTEHHIERLIADQGAPIAATILNMTLHHLTGKGRSPKRPWHRCHHGPKESSRSCIYVQSVLEYYARSVIEPSGLRLTKSGWIRLMRKLGYRRYRGRDERGRSAA
jgi:hypothetical protein